MITLSDLEQFTGSTTLYRYNLLGTKVSMTAGVKYLADNAKCYWLIDAILSYQSEKEVAKVPLQVWELERLPDNTLKLTCRDGEDIVIVTQDFSYSNFPLPEVKIYHMNKTEV